MNSNGYLIKIYGENGEVVSLEHEYDQKIVFEKLQAREESNPKTKIVVHEVGKCLIDLS
jgi:hypothetical protein